MTLTAGTRLGPYEIVGALGAGGMGEVYRARDTRLQRSVAIKILPADVAADPGPSAGSGSPRATWREDRRRRFEQEARAVSALAHPHICVLHDIGSDDGIDFLVMEYLEGQTAAERLVKGPLPPAQALDLAIQIADALAAAHRAGIVHRDLKPANVMLVKSAAGAAPVAKLLDFGLARLAPQSEHGADIATRSASAVIVGTVPYMSPEQVEGRAVDARTDLFAFGCLLYEMLTGRRAFEGSSPASVMAAILEHEPRAASTVQPAVSPAIDRVLGRCLAKDPDARWQTASDLAAELRWLRDGDAQTASAVVPTRRRRLQVPAAIAAALVLLAAGATAMWALRPAQQGAAGLALDLHPAQIEAIGYAFAPGGARTAFAWSADGLTLLVGNGDRLYARSVDEAVARPVAGTEGAQEPVVSPDGRWIAFWAGAARGRVRGIKTIPFGGGPVVDLVPNVSKPNGMAWDASGGLYFGNSDDNRVWTVAADRTTKPVTKPADGEIAHVLPSVLPGGKVVLYTVRKSTWAWGDEEVVAQSMTDGTRTPLLTDAADARYLPSGHLAFLRRGKLMAVAFDTERLETRGVQEVVQDAVAQALAGSSSNDVTGAGQFAVSVSGALAWIRSAAVEYPDQALVSVDRHGVVTRLRSEAHPFGPSVRLSPDGRRLVVSTQTTSTGAVWIYDLQTTGLRLVLEGSSGYFNHWWPNGENRLLVDRMNDGRSAFAWLPSDRTSQPQALRPSNRLWASSFTQDGRLLLVRHTGGTVDEVVVTRIEDSQAPFETLVEAVEKPDNPEVSPDGRWLAYTSRQSGQAQVYVKPFAAGGAPHPVSIDGGDNPAWNPKGGELFFTSARTDAGTHWMMVADFTPGNPPRLGPPRRLFEFASEELQFICNPVRCYDVAPDGQHFYTVQKNMTAFPATVTHVNYNPTWIDEVKRKVPTSRGTSPATTTPTPGGKSAPSDRR